MPGGGLSVAEESSSPPGLSMHSASRAAESVNDDGIRMNDLSAHSRLQGNSYNAPDHVSNEVGGDEIPVMQGSSSSHSGSKQHSNSHYNGSNQGSRISGNSGSKQGSSISHNASRGGRSSGHNGSKRGSSYQGSKGGSNSSHNGPRRGASFLAQFSAQPDLEAAVMFATTVGNSHVWDVFGGSGFSIVAEEARLPTIEQLHSDEHSSEDAQLRLRILVVDDSKATRSVSASFSALISVGGSLRAPLDPLIVQLGGREGGREGRMHWLPTHLFVMLNFCCAHVTHLHRCF